MPSPAAVTKTAAVHTKEGAVLYMGREERQLLNSSPFVFKMSSSSRGTVAST
jgi:hypothetical protein